MNSLRHQLVYSVRNERRENYKQTYIVWYGAEFLNDALGGTHDCHWAAR